MWDSTFTTLLSLKWNGKVWDAVLSISYSGTSRLCFFTTFGLFGRHCYFFYVSPMKRWTVWAEEPQLKTDGLHELAQTSGVKTGRGEAGHSWVHSKSCLPNKTGVSPHFFAWLIFCTRYGTTLWLFLDWCEMNGLSTLWQSGLLTVTITFNSGWVVWDQIHIFPTICDVHMLTILLYKGKFFQLGS